MNELINFAIIIAISVLVILVVVRRWIIELQNKSSVSDEVVEWLKDVGQRVESSNVNFDKKLTDSMSSFNKRLDKAAYVIAKVQKNIGEFSEIGRSMRELQDFLQSPKIRGNIGEAVLKDLIKQFLPNGSYRMQYSFKTGERVDAVIKTSKGLIPIDSKFPMENFRKMMVEEKGPEKNAYKKEFTKDVRKHISDIAKKYIKVSEGTLDYAIMYIPSESVYYEIISNQILYEYAGEKRVLIVSPMSFYAYLHVILMSFEGQKIEARAKEILSLLRSLQTDYEKADSALSILNKHITNAYNQVANVSRIFLGFGQKLESTRMFEERRSKQLEAD